MALIGNDLIRKYLSMQKKILFFLREIASLKLNMKVCDAIPGTLNVISEKNAAINENNRFTERFNCLKHIYR